MAAAVREAVAVALVARWDDMAAALIARYAGTARRVVGNPAMGGIRENPAHLGRWGEIVKAVRAA